MTGIAVGIWSQTVDPDTKVLVTPVADVRLTNVTLGHELADDSRTTIKFTFKKPITGEEEEEDDEAASQARISSAYLCTLTPGKTENASIDLVLLESEDYTFEVLGKNAVHLTGNYLDQNPLPPDFTDSDSDSDFGEDEWDLRDVSSDVEMAADPYESDASRFEEVDEETNSKKRAHDETDTPKTKLSKAEKKVLKKQKVGDGESAPTKTAAADAASKESKSEKKEDKKQGAESKKEKSAKVFTTAGGVKVEDAKPGSGPAAKKGNMVGMRYIGKLQNGTIFDSNTKGKPFTFKLGAGDVIKGWDEGIVGMHLNGERVLTIPPNMGYGKRGSGAQIPPNSTLIFEIKLVSLK